MCLMYNVMGEKIGIVSNLWDAKERYKLVDT
jgi:hypothetical protein